MTVMTVVVVAIAVAKVPVMINVVAREITVEAVSHPGHLIVVLSISMTIRCVFHLTALEAVRTTRRSNLTSSAPQTTWSEGSFLKRPLISQGSFLLFHIKRVDIPLLRLVELGRIYCRICPIKLAYVHVISF
jgi:hypothetical protein